VISNPALLLSDQKEKPKMKKKVAKKKPVDFLSLNKKHLNGRPKSKKFGLMDTKTLDKKNSNFNSTDNLLLDKKRKPAAKKKSVKPAEIFSDQDASRRARERADDKKRMAEVTPPVNHYSLNINVVKQEQQPKKEIHTVQVLPSKSSRN
jgi:hypothetical protein